MNKNRFMLLVVALLMGALVACGDEGVADNTPQVANPEDSEAPLSDLDSLIDGAPDSSKLPSEAKADQIFPGKFDLVELQSPVKSQGSRGVCSIFSTVALMEHLYLKEGTLANPDFSEQYLQWSAKFEVGSFPNTSGSNANSNLRAINRFGIVDEQAWPYESQPWKSGDDERCNGEDDQPTVCYTNGEPPESAKESKKWLLPRGRFVSSRVRSIKAVMHSKRTAVVSGMTFFYQSWNHRRSKLPVNSENWSEGYVLPPNDKDREVSLEKRAGHSILLVGWDDNLEVALVDENGDTIKDENGEEVTTKGFFMFKNSWGTGGFGIRHEAGAGYGWISYEYIEEFANSMTADIPSLDLDPEVCDDGIDNNFDRQADCEDPQCADSPACQPVPAEGDLSNNTLVEIPDNNVEGAISTIEVAEDAFLLGGEVDVVIAHTFIGDLTVSVIAPDGTETFIHKNEGNAQDDIKRSFDLSELAGVATKGTWTLRVIDSAAQDTGAIEGWALKLDTTDEQPDNPNPDEDTDNLEGVSEPGAEIPDDNSTGITDSISIGATGTVDSINVSVDIAHTFIGDLSVALTSPSGKTIILHDQEGGGEDNLVKDFTVEDFAGEQAQGDWILQVSDNAREDTGILNAWILEVTVQ